MYCWSSTAIFPEEAMLCLNCERDKYAELVARGDLKFSFDAGFYLGRQDLKLHNFFDLLFVLLAARSECGGQATDSFTKTDLLFNELISCYDFDDHKDSSNWMSFVHSILSEFEVLYLESEIEHLVARTHAVLATKSSSPHRPGHIIAEFRAPTFGI